MNDATIELIGLLLFAFLFSIMLYTWIKFQKETEPIHVKHMKFMNKVLIQKKNDLNRLQNE